MFKQLISTPLILLVFATGTLFAQNRSLNLDSNHEVIIDGTSNVRDWSAQANTVHAEFTLNGFEGESLENLQPEHFRTLRIQIPVEDINTDSGRLTRNIQDYLKKDDHPVITFELNSVQGVQANGGRATLHAEGVIIAAGQNHTTVMTVQVQYDGNGTFQFSGKQDLKMTDFEIDPPRAMLGSIRAVDDISIIYDVSFTL